MRRRRALAARTIIRQMQAADSSHRLPAHFSCRAPRFVGIPIGESSSYSRALALLDCLPVCKSSLRSAPGSVASLELGTAVVPPLVALCTLGVYPVRSATCVTALVTAASIPLPIRTLRCLALRCLPFLTYSPCFILYSSPSPSPSPSPPLLPPPLSRYHPGDPHRVDSALKAASVARPAAS